MKIIQEYEKKKLVPFGEFLPLEKYLKNQNRKVFNGLEMFIYQGQKAFYLWNKINPEIDNQLVELLNSKLQ